MIKTDKALFYYTAEKTGMKKPEIAKAMNLSVSGLCTKFSRGHDFTSQQILRYATATGCNISDINNIFFDGKLEFNSNLK